MRVRYVKVAEYQARGVVHFHAIIRLDAPGDSYQPPPGRYTLAVLTEAITQSAATVQYATGDPADPDARLLGFGAQTDTRPIRHGTRGALTAQAVANYIAKYATKSLDTPGLPDRPIRREADIAHLRCPPHYKHMITAAWRLGTRHAHQVARTWPVPKHADPHAIGSYLTGMRRASNTGHGRLRRWAHTLGYGGHYLTKSRRYSVTFGHLRRERTDYRRRQRWPGGERDPWGRELDERVVLVLGNWRHDGTGHTELGDRELALAAAARAREHDPWTDTAA